MLFLASTLGTTQATPEQFKRFGANQLAPAPVYESRVRPLTSTLAKYAIFTLNLVAVMACYALEGVINFEAPGYDTIPASIVADFLSRPLMSISFRSRVTDSTKAMLESLNFSQQTSGKRSFWVGYNSS